MIPEGRRLFFYRPGAVLRATGEDAFSFLQGQFTNELRQASGRVAYGLWLNQKGKVIADSHVLGVSEKEFVIVSTDSAAAIIQQRLEDYIVADDVLLSDETAEVEAILLAGAGSEDALARALGTAPAAGSFVRASELIAFRGRRLPGENFEIVGPAAPLAELRRRLLAEGFELTEREAIEAARLAAGIPSVPADLGPGDLPNEGGLDATAISYTKGCYLGQEVMARLKNLGQVRRRLHVVHGRGSVPAPLAALYQGERKIGEIRSAAVRDDGFVALAMLSLVNLQPDAALSLAAGGPPTLTIERHG